jgi:hypothetical protein
MQHGSPVYPHGEHTLLMQLFGASHGYGKWLGSVQQIPFRAPHGTQLLFEQVVPPAQPPPGQQV